MDIFDGRYEKGQLLGQGAFSEVWKVRDNQTNVTLALKIYNPTTGNGEDGDEMLTHEFALMVNANHKNLLRPLFYATSGNRPYLILPYCEKGNIGKMIGKMTEEETWKLLRDCASALSYLHAMNPPILHQDIKPANILLGDNGEYMLTDFGVSTQVKASLSRASNQDIALFSAGTISYMAPERFSRNNLPIMANDIYSLGSTAFEMLSGVLPFGNDGGLLQKKGAEVPEVPGDFSPLMKKTLEDCLQEEPWQRPTAEQLEEIANRALRHPELRFAVPKVNPEPEAKPTTMQIPEEYKDTISLPGSDSKKRLYAILAGIAAVIVIGGIILLSGGSSNDDQAPEASSTVIPDTDSLLKVAETVEYENCIALFKQESPDSIKSALIRMTALADKGNKEAIHEVAYTYAWIPSDTEADRRKRLLGWKINEAGLPISSELNKQAVIWLEKAISTSDSTDYKTLYWLSFYYINEIVVKRDFEKARQMLIRAGKEAEDSQDFVFKNKIDNTITQLKQLQ